MISKVDCRQGDAKEAGYRCHVHVGTWCWRQGQSDGRTSWHCPDTTAADSLERRLLSQQTTQEQIQGVCVWILLNCSDWCKKYQHRNNTDLVQKSPHSYTAALASIRNANTDVYLYTRVWICWLWGQSVRISSQVLWSSRFVLGFCIQSFPCLVASTLPFGDDLKYKGN